MKTKRRRKGSKAVLNYFLLSENANIATLDKRHTHTEMQ